MAQKQLGTPPSNSTDAATKAYVDAAVSRSTQTITAATTLGSNGDYIVFLGSGGVPTLPTAVGNTSKYTLKNTDTTNKTVATTSSQMIDGSSTITLMPNQSIDVVSDGANWRII